MGKRQKIPKEELRRDFEIAVAHAVKRVALYKFLHMGLMPDGDSIPLPLPLDESVGYLSSVFGVQISPNEMKIDKDSSEALVALARGGNRAAFDLAKTICEIRLNNLLDLDKHLSRFASAVLSGDLPRPKAAKSASRASVAARNYLVLELLDELQAKFPRLHRTRNEGLNDETAGISLWDVAREAFRLNGISEQLSFDDVRNLDVGKIYQKLRERYAIEKRVREQPICPTIRAMLIHKILSRA